MQKLPPSQTLPPLGREGALACVFPTILQILPPHEKIPAYGLAHNQNYHTHTHTLMYIHAHTHTHTHKQVLTVTPVCMHTHTYTHTHTHSWKDANFWKSELGRIFN